MVEKERDERRWRKSSWGTVLKGVSYASQVTIADTASTTPDRTGENTNISSSKHDEAGRTLTAHIRSYPPYCSHLHPSSLCLYHHRRTQSSVISLYLSMPWLWVNTEYSIHRVQHTPSTASTQDCLSSLHSHEYKLTPECSFSSRRASLQDHLPPASSPWELKGKVTSSHSHGCELTHRWIEPQQPALLVSTASKYISNLARSWPPSGSANSLDQGI